MARANIGEDLHPAGPLREKGQRLLVAGIETFRADDVGQVVLRGNFVRTVHIRIETPLRQEFGGGHEERAGKKVGIIPPIGTHGELPDTRKIVLKARPGRHCRPWFNPRVVE